MGFNEKLWADTRRNTNSIKDIRQLNFPSVVTIGDSITAQNGSWTDTGRYYQIKGYFSWLNWFNESKFNLIFNGGVGGNTTTQMLARFASVMAYDSDIFIVQGGINDVIGAITSVTTIANLKQMYDAVLADGRTLVITTVTPSTSADADAEFLKLCEINNFIRDYADSNPNVILVDWFKHVSNSIGRYWFSTYTADGTHPNELGAKKMGTILSNAIKDKLKVGQNRLVCEKANPKNLLVNGVLDTSDNVSATGWTYAGIANTTRTVVDYDNGSVVVKEQVLNKTVTGDINMNQTVTGIQAGRKIMGFVRVRLESVVALGYLRLMLRNQSIALSYSMQDLVGPTNALLFPTEFIVSTPIVTIPEGSTSILFQLDTTAFNGIVKYSNPTLIYVD